MKISTVSLTTFRSQAGQTQGNTENRNVNPYVYTSATVKEPPMTANNFKFMLGALGAIAVVFTLFKLAGKGIFFKK